MTLERGKCLSVYQPQLIYCNYCDSYRPVNEVKLAFEERDPIKIARSYAIDHQLATTDELEVSKIWNTELDTLTKIFSDKNELHAWTSIITCVSI